MKLQSQEKRHLNPCNSGTTLSLYKRKLLKENIFLAMHTMPTSFQTGVSFLHLSQFNAHLIANKQTDN